jgi:single-stranded-DNA-specific exonuclease
MAVLPITDAVEGEAAPVLGVASSALGRVWQWRTPADQTVERRAMALMQRFALPDSVARILAARGIGPEQAEQFLSPTLRALMPDPSVLVDMDRAAARIAQAIQGGEQIAIFGDYDVDGACSSALMVRYLRAVGHEPLLHIPDRIEEGYGPNAGAMRALAERGARLVVTVDCGVSAFVPLEAAADVGLEVVVIDHHEAEARLPRAHAVVNPNRLDDDSGLGTLCAAGVTFLVLVAINRSLRQAGVRALPDLLGWLDLVALATVCDVVPLTGLNRAFVTQGLKVLGRRANPGLSALADVARLDERPTGYHLGFVLGPRINAGGRVGQADMGARLLSTDDAVEARRLAVQLDTFNTERKAIELGVLEQAIADVDARLAASHDGLAPALLCVEGEGWHPGVIGIVASRLKDRYTRPAIVIGMDGEIGKGSGRSVQGVDLGGAVIAARQAGLLLNGGGHRMAAGLTVARAQLGAVHSFLAEHIVTQLQGRLPVASTQIDAILSVGGATTALIEALDRLGPFGAGNPDPRVVLADARIVKADVVGSAHVRCFLSDAGGSARLKAIAFRAVDTDLGALLLGARGASVHLAGQLRIDRWNGGMAVQLIIDDAAVAWGG